MAICVNAFLVRIIASITFKMHLGIKEVACVQIVAS